MPAMEPKTHYHVTAQHAYESQNLRPLVGSLKAFCYLVRGHERLQCDVMRRKGWNQYVLHHTVHGEVGTCGPDETIRVELVD